MIHGRLMSGSLVVSCRYPVEIVPLAQVEPLAACFKFPLTRPFMNKCKCMHVRQSATSEDAQWALQLALYEATLTRLENATEWNPSQASIHPATTKPLKCGSQEARPVVADLE